MIKWYSISMGNSSGPLIIFLHGFLGSSEDWLSLSHRLSSHYQCLLLDLPGHGKTVATETSDYSIHEIAKSLIEFLNERQVRKAILVGYSMGGRLALYMIVHYPQYFDKVILESTSPGLEKKEDRLQRQRSDEQWIEYLENMTIEKFLQKWYESPLFHTLKNHPKFDELLNRRLRNKSVNWPTSLRGMGLGKQPSLWKNLRQIRIPILILVGEKDKKFRYIAFKMKELNSKFSVSIVPNRGHNVHFEDESKYYQELIRFLNR